MAVAARNSGFAVGNGTIYYGSPRAGEPWAATMPAEALVARDLATGQVRTLLPLAKGLSVYPDLTTDGGTLLYRVIPSNNYGDTVFGTIDVATGTVHQLGAEADRVSPMPAEQVFMVENSRAAIVDLDGNVERLGFGTHYVVTFGFDPKTRNGFFSTGGDEYVMYDHASRTHLSISARDVALAAAIDGGQRWFIAEKNFSLPGQPDPRYRVRVAHY